MESQILKFPSTVSQNKMTAQGCSSACLSRANKPAPVKFSSRNKVLSQRSWFSLWTTYCSFLVWYYNKVGLPLSLWQWSRRGCMSFQPLLLKIHFPPYALLRGEWSYSSFETFIWNLRQAAKLTGQHAAGSMGSLNFQFWVFITTSPARSRVQTASRHFSGDLVKPSHECKVAAGSPHICEPEEKNRDEKFNISL